MAFKTKRPDFSSESTEEKLSALIRYVENLSEEIEFRLDSLSKFNEKIKRLNSGEATSALERM